MLKVDSKKLDTYLILFVYLVDALTRSQVMAVNKAAFGAVALYFVLKYLIRGNYNPLRILVLVVIIVGVLRGLWFQPFDMVYFASDLFTMLTLISAFGVKDLYIPSNKFIFIYLVIFVLAGLFTPLTLRPTGQLRFSPVPMLILFFVSVNLYKNDRGILWKAVAFIPLLYLQNMSGFRTSLITTLMVMFFVIFGRKVFVVFPIMAVIFLAILANGISLSGETDKSSSLERLTRFENLQDDQSIFNRFFEVRDAYAHMEENNLFISSAIGLGHGAQFRQNYALTDKNSKGDFIHNIHIGPMLIFFRYGMLGILIFLLIFAITVKALLREKKQSYYQLLAFAALLVFSDFLLRSILVDMGSTVLLGHLVASTYAKVKSSSSSSEPEANTLISTE